MSYDQFKCPTCEGYIPNDKTPGAYPGALSRRDNKTEVCSACGVREALEDLATASESTYSVEVRDFHQF